MIYVHKVAICDGCRKWLDTKLYGSNQAVNRHMSSLILENGWHFDGADNLLCRECWEKKKERENG